LEIRLAPEDSRLFDRGAPTPFYYLIWVRDGRLHSHSSAAPLPVGRPERSGGGGLPLFRNRGNLREAFVFAGPVDCFLVGRSIEPDLLEMSHRTMGLTLTGAAILAVGLAGGWWLAGRAIRPVHVIGATAARISGGDLSQRISLEETESELGRLAGVLNATFAQLETVFAQQTQFTSDAAHELRTPVTVILTHTQLALNRDRAAADYRETIEACQRAAQRMRRLIESLLALARIDSGQEPLRRRRFDLAETVRDGVELVGPLAREAGIPIETDLTELPCDGDSERLGQVIVNLLTNAIQYNHPGGQVTVRGRRSPDRDRIELAVHDTGPGIAPEHLPHVFDRFYRADRARTGSANAGLGLAISKAIVTAHGGTIECTSEPGAGAVFKITLPAATLVRPEGLLPGPGSSAAAGKKIPGDVVGQSGGNLDENSPGVGG
jgi:heavy metal sensor kinase